MTGTLINIYLNGHLHGMRRWQVIPRCGEHVWINNITQASWSSGKEFVAGWCVVRTIQYRSDEEFDAQPYINLFVTPLPVKKETKK